MTGADYPLCSLICEVGEGSVTLLIGLQSLSPIGCTEVIMFVLYSYWSREERESPLHHPHSEPSGNFLTEMFSGMRAPPHSQASAREAFGPGTNRSMADGWEEETEQ